MKRLWRFRFAIVVLIAWVIVITAMLRKEKQGFQGKKILPTVRPSPLRPQKVAPIHSVRRRMREV